MTKKRTQKKPIISERTEIIGSIRKLDNNQSVKFLNRQVKPSTVRSTISRLHKEGSERYSASERGMKDAILVTRTN
jgi:hypothetical protein